MTPEPNRARMASSESSSSTADVASFEKQVVNAGYNQGFIDSPPFASYRIEAEFMFGLKRTEVEGFTAVVKKENNNNSP